jgi:hypothetical protein
VVVKNLILVLVVLLLSGCAAVYKQAGISSLPSSEVAVVDVDPCGIGDSCIFFQEIDGKWRGVGSINRRAVQRLISCSITMLMVSPSKRNT